MSICELCEREMLDDGVSCIVTPVPTGTGAFHPIAFGSERVRGWKAESCGDCGVRPGGFHHRGCDMEECPRCRGQLISCGCDVSESPYDDLFDDEDPIERFPDLLPAEVLVSDVDGSQLLARLHGLLPDAARRQLGAMLAHHGPGRVRVSIVRTDPAGFTEVNGPSLRSVGALASVERGRVIDPNDQAYRSLVRSVGGSEQLRSLDTVNPLPDEPFNWAAVAAPNRVAVQGALAILERAFAEHAVPVELATACRRFLADLARSPIRQLRPTADGARIAAGVVWAVFTANDFLGSRRGWRTGTVWRVFGVTPSARDVGITLRQTAMLNRTGEFLPADEPALGHGAFYTLRMRRQFAAHAAVLRELADRRAS